MIKTKQAFYIFIFSLSLLTGCVSLRKQLPQVALPGPEVIVQAPPVLRIHEIVIDPGHGGKDPGARGITGLQEKDVVLDIAKRLKQILQDKGLKVMMTRETDDFISLQQRTEIVSQSKADLFVSIHANSSPAKNVSGVEVFSLKDLGYVEKNETQRKANCELMFETLAMKQGSKDLKIILEDMLYSHKQAQSLIVARNAAHGISQEVRAQNRGYKTSHFYVLRNTLIPAVLVEVGFLSHPREEKLLRTASYRQRIAEGLATGILEYNDKD